jgi:hypothetical protein
MIQKQWPIKRLLADRKSGDGGDKHLVQWAPSWQNAASISNLPKAVRSIEAIRVKL